MLTCWAAAVARARARVATVARVGIMLFAVSAALCATGAVAGQD